MIERLVRIESPYALRASLGSLAKSGMSPPIARWVDGVLFKATSTPHGPATGRFERTAEGVRVSAWGPGSDWLLACAERWLGLHDPPDGFEPHHPVLLEQHRRHPGLHLGHTHRVFDALLFVIPGQKVTKQGAMQSRRSVYRTWGETAPGPVELIVPPDPRVIRELGTFELHPHNIERRRAATLITAARHANRLEEAIDLPLDQATRRLQAVRGIGPWTAALVSAVALGDPDAVQIGDYHLKNTVAWLLAREERADDDRMLELLEPWRGRRRRVLHLLGATGRHAPRYGASLGVNDIRGR